MALAKPQLKGLFYREVIKTIWMTSIAVAIGGAATWFGLVRPRRLAYAEFHKNYDAEAEAEKYVPTWKENQ